jgi:AAA domain
VEEGGLMDPLVQKYLSQNGHLGDGTHAIPYSAIRREPVEWLRPGRVPLAMLTMLAGDPGLGKSLLTCQMAAEESRAGGAVLLATAEDSPAATVRPRLEAAQADLDLVHMVSLRRDGVEEGIALPDNIADLDGRVRDTGARLVVIDPLMAHLPDAVNSWRDQSVRTALAPLYRMAEERNCAVLIVLHLNKAKGADPLHRVGGSIGIPGAVRSALLLARDPGDPEGERGVRRVLAHVKCNVASLAPSLSYEIEPVLLAGDDRIKTARLRLVGESEHSGHDLLATPDPEQRTALDEAIDVLRAELADGERDAREVMAAVRAVAGVSERTVKTAKKELGVEAERINAGGRRGAGRWVWRLPPSKGAKDPAPFKGANPFKGASPISRFCTLKENPSAVGLRGQTGRPRVQSKTDCTLNAQPVNPGIYETPGCDHCGGRLGFRDDDGVHKCAKCGRAAA